MICGKRIEGLNFGCNRPHGHAGICDIMAQVGDVYERAPEPGIDKNTKLVIGQYADYLNTGIWKMKGGVLIAPEDLTIEQLKDYLLVYGGGYVFLNEDRRLCWAPVTKDEKDA
jgi:hypothetical protein